jgi:hypothetical protein
MLTVIHAVKKYLAFIQFEYSLPYSKIIVTGYLLDDGVPFPAFRGVFIFATASTHALRRALIQWTADGE